MPNRPSKATIVRQAAKREQERRERLRSMKEAAEADLLEFVRMFWRVVEPETKLVEGWVLNAICDALMAVADGHILRLLLNVFPGAMKSLMLNVFFPAWMWGPQNQPHLRFLSGSYSSGLPERDNARMLRILQDETYQTLWGYRFQLVRDGLKLIENNRTGWKRVISVSSGTTGHRGDYVLLDDANDPNTVESDAVRSATNLYLREVLPDRLNNLDESRIISIQQRTHEEDATGTLAKYGSGYTWISIPMEFDPLRDMEVVLRRDEDGEPIQWFRDPRGRDEDGYLLEGLFVDARDVLHVKPGSPMAQAEGALAWPQRFSPTAVQNLKKIKGPYAWAGQYGQNPSPRGGGIIRRDWWQLWSEPEFPALGTVVAGLDTAIKEGEANDYNAMVTFGAFGGTEDFPKLVLTSAWQERMSLAELVQKVAHTCWEKKVDYLVIEDKARGHDVAAELLRQFSAHDITWQTYLIPANGRGSFSGDKTARLQAVSVMFSGDVRKVPKPGDPTQTVDVWTGGQIYEPGREWSAEVVDQVCNFPTAAHDDYVDCVSMCLAWIRRNGVVVRKAEWEREQYESMLYRPTPGVPYAIGRRA